MPEIAIAGTTVHYEDTGGSGDAIVFAHGFLWSGAMYRPQVEALRTRYRCVTFDFRGQGQSQVAARGYDLETLTDDAARLIEAIGCAPCHFVGLSMGGFVGLRLALGRPDLLRSLTLIASAADREPRRNLPKYLAMAAVARLIGVAPLARPVMKIMFGSAFLEDPARASERAEMKRQLVANDRVGASRALGGVIGRRAVEGELGRVNLPTLVLSGEDDRAIVPARSRRMADAIPGARFVLLPRAGHTSTIEEPAEVNRHLVAFLDGIAR
ncbi:MAG: alpha/beta fold hydrolase [Myxococcales bacterium]|nr:alpha/beta fold hydrolase [Myxococcales bacterium]